MAWLDARTPSGTTELVVVNMPNERFDDVVAALGSIPQVRLTFQRDSVVLLEPPPDELPDQVSDVTTRGPLEMLVEGLQSLGAWPGFLAYSAVAGAIVFAGFVSNTIFLLTAAMLIAPYAAPAMTTAFATARGDGHLLRRSLGRYLSAIGVSTATAALLTLVTGVREVSQLMLQVADVPGVAILLPLAAGVAGALSFNQPDRTGIVSGAGVGMLVALALSPQAGLIGMGLVLGELRLVTSASFVAALQLVGINVAGAIVFRLQGVSTHMPRARNGSGRTVALGAAATAISLVAMLGLQLTTHPELSRETVVVRAEAATTAVLDTHPGVVAISATARFPLGGGQPKTRLAVEARALATGDGETPSVDALAALLRERLTDDFPDMEPIVGVTIVNR